MTLVEGYEHGYAVFEGEDALDYAVSFYSCSRTEKEALGLDECTPDDPLTRAGVDNRTNVFTFMEMNGDVCFITNDEEVAA